MPVASLEAERRVLLGASLLPLLLTSLLDSALEVSHLVLFSCDQATLPSLPYLRDVTDLRSSDNESN